MFVVAKQGFVAVELSVKFFLVYLVIRGGTVVSVSVNAARF